MKKVLSSILIMMLALSLFGCGSSNKKTKEIDTKAVVKQIADGVESAKLLDCDDDALKKLFHINPEDVESYGIKYTMINVAADNIAIIKPKAGKEEIIKKALEQRKAEMEKSFEQYLPNVYEVTKNAEIIEKEGYIALIMTKEKDKAIEIFNNAFK